MLVVFLGVGVLARSQPHIPPSNQVDMLQGLPFFKDCLVGKEFFFLKQRYNLFPLLL